jgi:hypothetical protein
MKRKINKKVTALSIIAIVCLILTYVVNWIFIIPAIVIMLMNHKELFGKKRY